MAGSVQFVNKGDVVDKMYKLAYGYEMRKKNRVRADRW